MASKVLFIDRDGTLIEEPADFQVDAVEKIRLVKGVIPALLELSRSGFRLVMVSNQDGLGSRAFAKSDFDLSHDFTLDLFASQGVSFDAIFICPHLAEDNCECRKPRTGLLTRYLAATDICLTRSAVIGDRSTDMALAERIGVQGLLVNSDAAESHDWPGVVERLCYAERVATFTRNTNETAISVAVNLDSGRTVAIDSGIGFYDHMLEQIAKHAQIGIDLKCEGDLEIDEHHTVEDTAICLGNAIRIALDSKHGIERYGFLLPMDESEAQVSLDLSGRAVFKFTGRFPRNSVGEFSTEMVEHFFRSLSDALGAALHIQVTGENTHHMVEACFKAVGRTLGQAIAMTGSHMPSTKGTLGA